MMRPYHDDDVTLNCHWIHAKTGDRAAMDPRRGGGRLLQRARSVIFSTKFIILNTKLIMFKCKTHHFKL